MSSITAHLNAIQTLVETLPATAAPSITAPVQTLIAAILVQVNDLADSVAKAERWADEFQATAKAANEGQRLAQNERDQAKRDLTMAKNLQAQASTVALLRELVHSPAKLLLVLREAGFPVGVRDLAGGTPAMAEDEIAILTDPSQHGPSMIAILNKI
jgi:hypothetical protein